MTTLFETEGYSIKETTEGQIVSVVGEKVRPITRKSYKGFGSDAVRDILRHRGIPLLVVNRIILQAYGY